MTEMGLNSLQSDPCAFRKGTIWVLLYVDDVIVMGANEVEINKVKESLSERLEMKYLGS